MDLLWRAWGNLEVGQAKKEKARPTAASPFGVRNGRMPTVAVFAVADQ
jgi:hypothetical protein